MKQRFLLSPILIGILFIIGCSSRPSPESVAEKALYNIGNGKYSKTDIESQLQKDSDIFTLCCVDNYYGEMFLSEDSLLEAYLLLDDREESIRDMFQTNVLFNEIKLVDKEEETTDVYGFVSRKRLKNQDEFERLKKEYSSEWKNFKSNNDYMAGIMYENIPCYDFRYKVDNSDVANVLVLKLPEEGYRVAMVMFDSSMDN